ncbi:MAG: hypothetical protein KC482_01425 [Dehalococcoidia bacterium]|nr:hypothetical protein [Dehalococcoidia bacterium]
MKEDHRPSVEGQRPSLVYRYEDGYDAEIHPNFESLSEHFARYAEGPFRAYNVPVWIEYDKEQPLAAVSVGVILTRHGICMIWRAPASPAQYHELQTRMLSVWAGRADAGFGRFLWTLADRERDDS